MSARPDLSNAIVTGIGRLSDSVSIRRGLDLSAPAGVTGIDPVNATTGVQGMCTYEDLVDENLRQNRDGAVNLAGEPTARLHGLHAAGSEWGFGHNVVQLHQVPGVKPDAGGGRGDVPERAWWRAYQVAMGVPGAEARARIPGPGK